METNQDKPNSLIEDIEILINFFCDCNDKIMVGNGREIKVGDSLSLFKKEYENLEIMVDSFLRRNSN